MIGNRSGLADRSTMGVSGHGDRWVASIGEATGTAGLDDHAGRGADDPVAARRGLLHRGRRPSVDVDPGDGVGRGPRRSRRAGVGGQQPSAGVDRRVGAGVHTGGGPRRAAPRSDGGGGRVLRDDSRLESQIQFRVGDRSTRRSAGGPGWGNRSPSRRRSTLSIGLRSTSSWRSSQPNRLRRVPKWRL